MIHSSVMTVVGILILGELVGWSIRWRSIGPTINALTHTVNALVLAGERSGESLAQLKDTRARVQEKRTAGGGGPEEQAAPDGRTRFDVGDQQAKVRAGDLQQELGGAKTEPDYVDKRRAPADGDKAEGDDEDVTSRLLKAKRRARRDIDKSKE